MKIVKNEYGFYIQGKSKNVTYGQLFKVESEKEAIRRFKILVSTYETKGTAYVMSHGVDY